MTDAAELHVAGLELLLAAVHAGDPKRELLVRVGDAIREAKALAAQQDGGWQPLPGEDLPDTYMRLRNGLDLKVAAEAASRNDDLCRIEGETDAEFVVRIVATYMAVSGHEQGSQRADTKDQSS